MTLPTTTTALPRSEGAVSASPANRLRWAALLAFVLGAAGINGYWYWRDREPSVSLGTVSQWIRAKRIAEAEAALNAHLRRHPHDADARLLLARALAAREDIAGCARELLRVPKWSPLRAEALLRAGESLLATGRAREAESALAGVIKGDPHHAPSRPVFQEACKDLFELYATEDRRDDAQALIWKAVDEGASSDRLPLLEVRTRSETERASSTDARPILRRHVAADPADTEALRALARAELAHGQRYKAREYLSACVRAHPDDPGVWRDYLAALWNPGDQRAFLAAVQRLPKSADSDPEVLHFRGLAHEEGGNWAKARDSYREALERNPFVAELYERLAQVEERLGETQKAVEHQRRAESLRAARKELSDAYAAYRNAVAQLPKASEVELDPIIKRIVTACETLGLSRMATAWKEQISEPGAPPPS
ncbi:MAG: tetratricopeptide repeat protein [Isosphaeraceae bacterium]|nr:tetratricopeptide repeat protein [Isosphaeraceae bacterium]